ncbi:MAG: sodium:alanine symporter family protein [Chlamydiia bacterium]|nr:sodium:alanine symporter family protein [Chlamydiia bacterium]
MMTVLFQFLESLNNFLWGYLAFVLIMVLGGYFSFRSRFFQIRRFGAVWKTFFRFLLKKEKKSQYGIHPLKAFFAAIGGCIGIGNVVGICTAIQIGVPGALFWTWVGGLAGMLIQYAEVYLGMRYRIKNKEKSYDGGPMYFLPIAYKMRWIAPVIAVLLCIYGVEIFMFNVIADSMSVNWDLPTEWVVLFLLIATVGVALGGINRVGEVCSAIIPLFIVLYLGMGIYVIVLHFADIPYIIWSVLQGAFTAQAAQGGFAGSTIMLTISMGLSRGAYSGDIGIGYNAVIHAESSTKRFERQASLTIIGIFIDTFVICTLSLFIVLATGYWNMEADPSLMVQRGLSLYFPYMHLFMPFFLFLLGYTTLLAYFVVGVKCAKFLNPKWGPILYYTYAIISLPLFAFVESAQAFLIMSLSGALLLLFNLFGMFLLRKEVKFGLDESIPK